MICIFKCPNCGDQMKYSIEKEMLICNSCQAEIEPDSYDLDYIDYDINTSEHEDISTFKCTQCSAVIKMHAENSVATCSYCHADLIAYNSDNKEVTPESIIPFKLTKEEAEKSMISWWVAQKTMPEIRKEKMNLEIKGIYVPVWLTNAETTCEITADVTEYDNVISHSLIHIVAHKKIGSNFQNMPLNASTNFTNEYFHGIEPFNYHELEPFNPAYLTGLQAEKYYFNCSQIMPTAIRKARLFAEKQGEKYVSTTCASDIGENNILKRKATAIVTDINYVLLPVWICSYIYRGKKHFIYINGQTGKVNGEILNAKSTDYKTIKYSFSKLLEMTGLISFVLFMLKGIKYFTFKSWDNSTFVALTICGCIYLSVFVVGLILHFRSTGDQFKAKIESPNGGNVSRIVKGLLGIMISFFFYYKLKNNFAAHEVENLLVILIPTAIALTTLSAINFAKKRDDRFIEMKNEEYLEYMPLTTTRIIIDSQDRSTLDLD